MLSFGLVHCARAAREQPNMDWRSRYAERVLTGARTARCIIVQPMRQLSRGVRSHSLQFWLQFKMHKRRAAPVERFS